MFHHNASEVLVDCRAYIRSELLTQWNAGCKTLNNDHYDYTYYQRLSAFHVLLLYDRLHQISFQGNVHMRRKETFNELNSSNIIRSETLSLLL